MVTLTFSALSSGFPPPCRQQGPQRAAPWSCSSSGGCHTRGSSQPLSQTAAPHSSHICGTKEGGQRHRGVKQNWNTAVCPFLLFAQHICPAFTFCSTQQGQQVRALHPPGHNRLSSTSTGILTPPAQTSPALCWHQAPIQTKWWVWIKGKLFLTPANPFHMGHTARSLFTPSMTSLHKNPVYFLDAAVQGELNPSMDTNLACRLPSICQSYHRGTATNLS